VWTWKLTAEKELDGCGYGSHGAMPAETRALDVPGSFVQVCLQFTSPVCSAEGYSLEESPWAFESARTGHNQPEAHCSSSAMGRQPAGVPQGSGAPFGAARGGMVSDQGSGADSFNSRFQLSQAPGPEGSKGWGKKQGGGAGRVSKGGANGTNPGAMRLSIPGSRVGGDTRIKGEAHASSLQLHEAGLDQLVAAGKASAQEKTGLFAVHLLVTAIAEGKILATANPKVIYVLVPVVE
jgi:hypothetical protein